jgi:hypothetical protein
LTTIYNTVSEAGFEANDTYKSVYNKLISEGVDEATAKERAAIAAKNTFFANAAVLLAPNFIQSKFFLGGFKNTVKGIKNEVKRNIGDLSKIKGGAFKKAGEQLALGIASVLPLQSP